MALPATHKSAILELCEDFLSSQSGIEILQRLIWQEDWLEGKFRLDMGDRFHDFEIRVPADYPMGKIQFYCRERSNTAHCLEDGKVCIVPAFSPNAAIQLQVDWDSLTNWIVEFVVSEKPALRYAYPSLPRLPIYMVFCEGARDEPLRKGDCGTFKYSKVYPFADIANKSMPTAIALDLAGKKADWVDSYKTASKFEGAWIYIETEPRDYQGALVTIAAQLDSLFTPRLRKEVRRLRASSKQTMFQTLFPAHFPLMIGYKISHEELEEVHWEMMLVSILEEEVLKSLRSLTEFLGLPLSDVSVPEPVIWGNTLNASYDRFFGRGKLTDTLTNARIMIIGVGAIGGTLAEMLVRGGCRHLTIVDYDIIQPGNVCRSVYPFLSMNRPKTTYLLEALRNISPFVNLKALDMFPIVSRNDPKFDELRQAILPFDIIFDCSATHQVAWMLDQMDVDAQIINLSVTDEAKELLMVCNHGNILQQKEEWLVQLGSHAQPSYYEGLGCWSPTFRADIATLNAPLCIALSRINATFEKGERPESFVLQRGANFEIREIKLQSCGPSSM
jgi:hypothetical protein